LYVAVIDAVPIVAKEVVNAAVPPAPDDVPNAGTGVTATGLPMGVAPLKNVTVPVVPAVLLLAEDIVAVSVTLVPAATVDALEARAVVVAACDTVTLSVTGTVTAL
jgi:hypothetical protein